MIVQKLLKIQNYSQSGFGSNHKSIFNSTTIRINCLYVLNLMLHCSLAMDKFMALTHYP